MSEKQETRGRKPNPEGTEDTRAMQVLAKQQEENELEIKKIDELYLPEGESYNLHIVIERAKFYQAQTATAFIELGKQIILLKAHEPHGQFLLAIEELGMAERSARYAMAAAQKFSNRQSITDLGRTKMMALTVLDDDSIKTLDAGGTLFGIGTLDEVDQMTVKELKAALRAEKKKRKEEREAQEAAIRQKEQKLNELEMELRYREPPTKEELAQAKLDELKKRLFREVGEASHAVHCLMQTISEAQQIPDVNITQLQDFITLEPEDFLSSIFDYTDELDDMIENIRPDRSASETEVLKAEIINEE
jgi:hypothetical protein